MKYKNAYQLYKDIDRLAEEDNFTDALEVLLKGLDELPREEVKKHFSFLIGVKAYFYQKCQMHEEFYNTVKYLHHKGVSCHPWRFNQLPSNLQSDKKYIDLKKDNDELIIRAKKQTKVKYVVHLPKGYRDDKEYPVFFALHQGGDNIDIFSWYWKPESFLKNDIILVYIQSSQLQRHDSYSWINDITTARKDIKFCYDSILDKYSIDKDNVMIGGFSCGGELSIDMAMDNIIPIKGFVALCPHEKFSSFTKENVSRAVKRGVKGVLMEGEFSLPIKVQEDMIDVFNKVKFPYQYQINKGIESRAPEDLSSKLDIALNYIMN